MKSEEIFLTLEPETSFCVSIIMTDSFHRKTFILIVKVKPEILTYRGRNRNIEHKIIYPLDF